MPNFKYFAQFACCNSLLQLFFLYSTRCCFCCCCLPISHSYAFFYFKNSPALYISMVCVCVCVYFSSKIFFHFYYRVEVFFFIIIFSMLLNTVSQAKEETILQTKTYFVFYLRRLLLQSYNISHCTMYGVVLLVKTTYG